MRPVPAGPALYAPAESVTNPRNIVKSATRIVESNGNEWGHCHEMVPDCLDSDRLLVQCTHSCLRKPKIIAGLLCLEDMCGLCLHLSRIICNTASGMVQIIDMMVFTRALSKLICVK